MRHPLQLLKAKLVKPGYPAVMVARPHLFCVLDRWEERRAIVIFAPAGFGKSSLVSHWIDHSPARQQIAWLTLDENDDDPIQFIHSFAAALNEVVPGALAFVRLSLGDGQVSPAPALTHLLVALEDGTLHQNPDAPTHILIVLDDLHRATSADVNALVLTLLERGPRRLHFLLLARSRTDMPLARLFAHEAVTVLEAGDLRFSPEEISRLVELRGFAPPTATELSELVQRSEGWVMALQLAILAVRPPGRVADLLRALHGDNIWLAEFLVDEVLQQQTSAVRQFMLQTSLLDEFNAPLCAAVTGTRDAYAKLAAIAKAGLFLIPLAGGWNRYHHLFQELLQRQLLAQADGADVACLHLRAAEWLAGQGYAESAVHHFLAAGADDKAASFIEDYVRTAIVGDPQAAKRLLGLLPLQAVERRPQLMLDRGLVAILMNSVDAPLLVHQAGRTVQSLRLTPADAPGLYAEWLVQCATVAFSAADLRGTAEYLSQAEPYEQHLSDIAIGLLHFLQTHLMRYAGRVDEMNNHAAVALAAFQRTSFDAGRVALLRELGRWSMRSGHSRKAARQFDAIFRHLPSDSVYSTRELAFAYFYAADNSYWRNELNSARRYLQSGQALAEQLYDDDLIHFATRFVLLLDIATGATAADRSTAGHLAGPVNARGLSEMLLDLETRLLLMCNSAADAERLLEETRLALARTPVADGSGALISYLRAYIAHGVELMAVMPLLSDALAYRAKIDDRFHLLQLLALRAWLQLRVCNMTAAVATCSEAADLAKELGYPRVLLDIPAFVDLILEADSSAKPDGLRGSHSTQLLPTAADLTAQERSVLALLAAEYTYQQVANELVVSVNTVRTHVRHIYRKLAVHRKERALEKARRYGYIE